MVGSPDAFEHGISQRLHGDEGLVLVGDGRRPRDEQRMGEDMVATMEDEGDDPRLGTRPARCAADRSEMVTACENRPREIPVDADRSVQEQDRRVDGRGPERRLPGRTGQGLARFEPWGDFRANRTSSSTSGCTDDPPHLRFSAPGSVMAIAWTCGVAPSAPRMNWFSAMRVVELHVPALDLLHCPTAPAASRVEAATRSSAPDRRRAIRSAAP